MQKFETVEDSSDRQVIRANALRFSTKRFRQEFKRYVQDKWEEYKKNIAVPEFRPVAASSEIGYKQVNREQENVVARNER